MNEKEEAEILATIKSCPFCGSTRERLNINLIGEIYVECSLDGCLAYGPTGSSMKDAVDKWNRRA
jgi:Lar family restriction alleviation protein